jgi:hypothetical protein
MMQTNMREWVQTDELQWVMRISEDTFQVIEVTILADQHCLVTDMEVDLSLFTDDDLEKQVSGYYDNLSHLKEVCGADWKQIVAEIVAEQNTEDRINFKNTEAVRIHLRKKYRHLF